MRQNKKSKAVSLACNIDQIRIQVACQLGVAALLLIVLALMSGCSKRYDDMPAYLPFAVKEYPNQSVGRFKTTYLADQIDQFYRGTNPGPLGVTTFVNIDDLYSTSTFGRMLGEQLMGELAMRGFDVIELRHSDALHFLNQGGEFGLSRDVSVLRRERDLGGVIVGTYVVSPVRVYLNARLLNPNNSMVLSAASAEMTKSDEIARLLRGSSLPASLERIPVKHLGFATYPMMMFPSVPSYSEEGGPFPAANDSWIRAPKAVEPQFGATGKASEKK